MCACVLLGSFFFSQLRVARRRWRSDSERAWRCLLFQRRWSTCAFFLPDWAVRAGYGDVVAPSVGPAVSPCPEARWRCFQPGSSALVLLRGTNELSSNLSTWRCARDRELNSTRLKSRLQPGFRLLSNSPSIAAVSVLASWPSLARHPNSVQLTNVGDKDVLKATPAKKHTFSFKTVARKHSPRRAAELRRAQVLHGQPRRGHRLPRETPVPSKGINATQDRDTAQSKKEMQ